MTDSTTEQKNQEQPVDFTIGVALRSLRESKKLELSQVSARIKYTVVQLGYLEQENWQKLPKGVPLRGFVRNYAKYLGADVDAMLSLLDDSVGPTKPAPSVTDLGAKNTVQAESTPRGEPAHRTWAWLLVILIVLCIAGAYAINRGWVPDEWLIFDWLKALRQ